MKAVLPEDDPERLNVLRRYRILDTPPNGAFDHFAEAIEFTFLLLGAWFIALER